MIGNVSKDVTQHGNELAQHAVGVLIGLEKMCVDSHKVEGMIGKVCEDVFDPVMDSDEGLGSKSIEGLFGLLFAMVCCVFAGGIVPIERLAMVSMCVVVKVVRIVVATSSLLIEGGIDLGGDMAREVFGYCFWMTGEGRG